MRLRANGLRVAHKPDQALAKEGEKAVPPVRQFPLDEPAAGPLRASHQAQRTDRVATASASRWPVLARIAEVNRASETAPASARTTYRIDAPHAEPAPAQAKSLQAATGSVAAPAGTAAPTAHRVAPASPPNQDRVLRAAPLPIRIALEAAQWIQPQQKLLRLAVMIALMSAGGMGMVMIMNDQVQPDEPPAAPAATAKDTAAVPELEIQHAELDRALVPTTGPAAEIDTDTLEPTATGPLPAMSAPMMAIEREKLLPTLPYPTTVRPEPLEPIFADDSLPQAQFEEPAVAQLKGTVEETAVR